MIDKAARGEQRKEQLQLSLTRDQMRELLEAVRIAGTVTDTERLRSYLEYRSVRKWGSGWAETRDP